MNMIMLISMMIFILTLMIMMLALILSKKTSFDREKNSPFECGFDPKGKTRIPFSMRFFLITVIFLIFDVEITLILPLILTMNFSKMNIWITLSLYFISILLLSTYYEWKYGALNWLN
nr:NADH dehydrogenase subunit 3 [Eutomostethus vegetus]